MCIYIHVCVYVYKCAQVCACVLSGERFGLREMDGIASEGRACSGQMERGPVPFGVCVWGGAQLLLLSSVELGAAQHLHSPCPRVP